MASRVNLQQDYPMRQNDAARLADDDVEEEDVEDEGVEIPTSRPGMRAVRRRSSSGRRHRPTRTTSETHFRQIRLALLAVVLLALGYFLTPASFHNLIGADMKQIFRPFKGVIHTMHLEVVALVVAAAVLLYLTPGVEDFVLRLLGIRRAKPSSRR